MRPREAVIRSHGLRIQTRDTGSGPPLLLINGLGAPTTWWEVAERRLDGLRLISFDAPGVGRSETPLYPVPIDRLAAIAADVLDHAGVERADVLGYSLGGMVAQALAVRQEDRVRRLVLASTNCGIGSVPAPLLHLLAVATPLRSMSKTVYDRTTPGLLGGRMRTDPAFVQEHKDRRFGSSPSKRGYMMQLMALQGWSSLQRLSRITAPTLVVTGDDDPLMPPVNAYILARRIPGARLHVVPGQGHLVLMDDRSPAFAAIRDVLLAHDLDDAPAWRDATVVDDVLLDGAMRAVGGSLQPLRAMGAVWRRAWPPPVRPAG